MRGCRCKNGLGLPQSRVDEFETLQKTRYGGCADGDVPPDLDVAMAQLAWNDPYPFLGLGILDPQEVLGQVFAKPPVNLADRARCNGAAF